MLQSMGSQRVRHNLATKQQHINNFFVLFFQCGPLLKSSWSLLQHHFCFQWIHFTIKKEPREYQKKNLLLFYWLCQSLWLCRSQKNCGKFFKRWESQTTWPASWETCMQVKKQQLELDMEQQIGLKLGKEYIKAVYCHPAYLIYIQSTSCEMWN